jgi:phosphate transport system permease protein
MSQATPALELRTSLRGSAARRRRERFVQAILLAGGLASIGISALIVVTLIADALRFLAAVDLSALNTIGWAPRRGMFDLPTLLIGTFLVSAIAMLLAAPIGLLSAIYLSEYATPRVRSVVKPILEILAGIPSIVLGFFAIAVISHEIVQQINPKAPGFNVLAASIGVGILSIPLVASVAEDAMRAVPRALREASYGLGARRLTTSLRVVFPAAISGIVAALILATSRAIGETMVVAVAAGASGSGARSWDIFAPGQTLTAAMASLAIGSDQVRGDDLAFPSLFFLGAVLFAMTFLLNVIGDAFVRRTRQRY